MIKFSHDGGMTTLHEEETFQAGSHAIARQHVLELEKQKGWKIQKLYSEIPRS